MSTSMTGKDLDKDLGDNRDNMDDAPDPKAASKKGETVVQSESSDRIDVADRDQPDELDEVDGADGEDDARGKDDDALVVRGGRRRVGGRVILAAAAVVLAAAAASITTWQAHDAEQIEEARTQALEAAKTRVPTLLSYQSSSLEADLKTAIEQTTGSFHDDYATVLDQAVAPAAEESSISTQAEVSAAGVVSATADKVVVLVFLTQTTTANGRTSVSGSRVDITMQRDGDDWKIAGLEPK